MTAALLAGLFIGLCIGMAAGIFIVLGTLSLQALDEREFEGYPVPGDHPDFPLQRRERRP